jgi:hypothetical protein
MSTRHLDDPRAQAQYARERYRAGRGTSSRRGGRGAQRSHCGRGPTGPELTQREPLGMNRANRTRRAYAACRTKRQETSCSPRAGKQTPSPIAVVRRRVASVDARGCSHRRKVSPAVSCAKTSVGSPGGGTSRFTNSRQSGRSRRSRADSRSDRFPAISGATSSEHNRPRRFAVGRKHRRSSHSRAASSATKRQRLTLPTIVH